MSSVTAWLPGVGPATRPPLTCVMTPGTLVPALGSHPNGHIAAGFTN